MQARSGMESLLGRSDKVTDVASNSRWLIHAVPAILASVGVLAWGDVGTGGWTIQLACIALAVVIGLWVGRLFRYCRPEPWVWVVGIGTLCVLAAPWLAAGSGPARWLQLGQFRLYGAPVVLPMFLVACCIGLAQGGRLRVGVWIAIPMVSLILALQPDASQALALLSAACITLIRPGIRPGIALGVLVPTAMATAWAFARPDPLQPVPHVEEVFALALGYSAWAGVAVIASALWLLAGLYLSASPARPWLMVAAVYYAVLYLCSVAGLTPAPLIGLGAGPWLGFGLLVAASEVGGWDVRTAR